MSKKNIFQIIFVHFHFVFSFSYCKFPFVLQPDTKSELLHFESAVYQEQQKQDAITNLFSGEFTDPILTLYIYRQHLIETSLSEVKKMNLFFK